MTYFLENIIVKKKTKHINYELYTLDYFEILLCTNTKHWYINIHMYNLSPCIESRPLNNTIAKFLL